MEGDFGYGYPRYGNLESSLLTISNSDVAISSNVVAGGCVWQWTWNGIQFINIHDFGREMQSSVSWFNGSQWEDPTEAGDGNSCAQTSLTEYYLTPQDRQGSPLVTAYNSGSSQTTACVPLDFNPQNWGGGLARMFRETVFGGWFLMA
jgi:hypothetical protein